MYCRSLYAYLISRDSWSTFCRPCSPSVVTLCNASTRTFGSTFSSNLLQHFQKQIQSTSRRPNQDQHQRPVAIPTATDSFYTRTYCNYFLLRRNCFTIDRKSTRLNSSQPPDVPTRISTSVPSPSPQQHSFYTQIYCNYFLLCKNCFTEHVQPIEISEISLMSVIIIILRFYLRISSWIFNSITWRGICSLSNLSCETYFSLQTLTLTCHFTIGSFTCLDNHCANRRCLL